MDFNSVKIVNCGEAYRISDAFWRGGVALREILKLYSVSFTSTPHKDVPADFTKVSNINLNVFSAPEGHRIYIETPCIPVHKDTIMREYFYECFKRKTFHDFDLLRSLILAHGKLKNFPALEEDSLALGIRLGDIRTLGVCPDNGFTNESKKLWDVNLSRIKSFIKERPSIKKIRIITAIHMAKAGAENRNDQVYVPAAYNLLDYIGSEIDKWGLTCTAATGDHADEDLHSLCTAPFLFTCGGGLQHLANVLNKNPSVFVNQQNNLIKFDAWNPDRDVAESTFGPFGKLATIQKWKDGFLSKECKIRSSQESFLDMPDYPFG